MNRRKFDVLVQRYIHDARFHLMVHWFRRGIATREMTAAELRDALRLAKFFADGDLERQRKGEEPSKT